MHAQASATGQTPWGSRGIGAAQKANTYISALGIGFGHAEIKFQYDNANKAVYINGTIIRDFDAPSGDLNDGSVTWDGFKTDEVARPIVLMSYE